MNAYKKMRMKVALAGVGAAGLMLLAACGGKQGQRAEGPAVSVKVSAAAEHLLPASEDFVGNIQSREAVRISTKLMGRVIAVHVSEGQAVKKGQLLVSVDDSEARSAYEQAKAGLEAAKVAMRNAERDNKRFEALYEQKAVTKHRLEQVQMGLAQAKAQKTQAASNLQAAQTLLSYGQIRAPESGIITKKWMDAGNMAYPGAPLLTLQNPAKLEIDVQVPENLAQRLDVGQGADVSVDSLDNTFKGKIIAVVRTADPMTRTSTVKLSLPHDPALLPGQFAHVRFSALATKGLAVDKTALVHRGQMDGVFVVTDGLARLRYVQVGQEAGGLVQILSGLDKGEKVIDPVPEGLADGTQVEVKP